MSTEPAQPSSKVSFSGLGSEEPKTKTDDAFAVLEQQFKAEKDARSEERFIWIVICTVLIDVLWFRGATNPTLPLVALILELIVLLVLARRMGIDDVVVLVDRILHSAGKRAGGE